MYKNKMYYYPVMETRAIVSKNLPYNEPTQTTVEKKLLFSDN